MILKCIWLNSKHHHIYIIRKWYIRMSSTMQHLTKSLLISNRSWNIRFDIITRNWVLYTLYYYYFFWILSNWISWQSLMRQKIMSIKNMCPLFPSLKFLLLNFSLKFLTRNIIYEHPMGSIIKYYSVNIYYSKNLRSLNIFITSSIIKITFTFMANIVVILHLHIFFIAFFHYEDNLL